AFFVENEAVEWLRVEEFVGEQNRLIGNLRRFANRAGGGAGEGMVGIENAAGWFRADFEEVEIGEGVGLKEGGAGVDDKFAEHADGSGREEIRFSAESDSWAWLAIIAAVRVVKSDLHEIR